MIEVVKHLKDRIDYISLKNDHLEVVVSNYGCTIINVYLYDRYGYKQDVVLGYDTITDYQNYDAYLGALVGRVANRIAKGKFTLNGQDYQLAINNGPNSLHGGIKGFSYRVFDYEIQDERLIFHYVSEDGEENYPGTLDFYAIYQLKDDALVVEYKATTTKDTLINITNHSYFNLSGHPCNIDEHYLKVCSEQYAPVDPDGLVTGDIVSSKGTPFDFTTETKIKDHIYQDDQQLEIGRGYDHPFIFNQKDHQVTLYCEETGIELTVSTTLPQAQLYSANYLDGRIGKNGLPMHERSALCIETQNMPDSIHNEDTPTVILKKGETYDEITSYQFKVR